MQQDEEKINVRWKRRYFEATYLALEFYIVFNAQKQNFEHAFVIRIHKNTKKKKKKKKLASYVFGLLNFPGISICTSRVHRISLRVCMSVYFPVTSLHPLLTSFQTIHHLHSVSEDFTPKYTISRSGWVFSMTGVGRANLYRITRKYDVHAFFYFPSTTPRSRTHSLNF